MTMMMMMMMMIHSIQRVQPEPYFTAKHRNRTMNKEQPQNSPITVPYHRVPENIITRPKKMKMLMPS